MKKIFPLFSLHIGTTVGIILAVIIFIFTADLLWSLLIGTSAALLLSLFLPVYFMRSERAYKKLASKVTEKKLFYEWIKLVVGNAAIDARIFLTQNSIYLMALGKGRNLRMQIPKATITDVFLEQDLHLHIKYRVKEKDCSVHVVTPFGEEMIEVFKKHGFLK